MAILPTAFATPRHHLPDGTFRNNYIDNERNSFADFLRWRREAPPKAAIHFPLAKKNPAILRDNRIVPTVTWIGHATLLVQINGVNLLTDPHFTDIASPMSFFGPKRTTPPGLTVDELPPINGVLISHNHYDHLDAGSISLIANRQPSVKFLVPLRLKSTVAGFVGDANRVSEFDWGETTTLDGLAITAEPCQHWSKRGLADTNKTLWASWVVQAPSFRFLFIGDTGYSQDFADLGKKYGGFDLAAIPIGAYKPRWFMKNAHVNPTEAVKILQDARIRFAVATHWGTFPLTDEPMDEPPQKLAAALKQQNLTDERFAVFQHGETRDLSFLSATQVSRG